MKLFIYFKLISLLLLPLCAPAQAWKWAKSLGSPDHSTRLTSTRSYDGGSVLVSGSFAAPTLNLDNQTLHNAGQDDGFVAIANENGSFSWAASMGGTGRDFAVAAAAASNGSFYVAGNFNSLSMTIGGTTLVNTGESDGFLVKFNQDKSIAWAKKIGSIEIDEITNLAVDGQGNVLLTGHVLDRFTQTTIHSFVQKLADNGNLIWEKKGSLTGGLLRTEALTLDEDQNIYIGGMLYGAAVFDGNIQLLSDTGFAALIIKLSPAGVFLDNLLDSQLDKINALQAKGGHLFACAEKTNYYIGWGWPLSDSKTHVVKYSSNLDQLWHKTAGGLDTAQSLDIAKNLSVDDEGNVYAAGTFFSDTLTFAGQELVNTFTDNYFYPQIFVFKYSPSGEELWAKSLGGLHTDEATSILAVAEDKFYLGGVFESNPATFGNHSLHNSGTLDSFYVHLKPLRFGREPMGFLAFFDQDASSTRPDVSVPGILVYPNPTAGYFVVALKGLKGPFTIGISNAQGKLIRQSNHEGQSTEIMENIKDLKPGIYFITIQTEGHVMVKKLLKI